MTTLTLDTASSHLTLPARSPGETVTFAAPQHGARAPATNLDSGHVARSSATDLLTGVASYTTVGQGGLFGEGVTRWDETGTTLSHDLQRQLTVHPDDPLSAESTIVQSYLMEGHHFAVRIETVTAMKGDRHDFTISGTLKVFEAEQLVHTREWLENVPRDHL